MTEVEIPKTAVRALLIMKRGAQDYSIKDRITPDLLERAIRRAIRHRRSSWIHRLLTRLRAGKRKLKRRNRRPARSNRIAHRAVADVSHDFRTPLTVITEYVSLLRDGVVGECNDQQRRMLDVIADRADDLNNMLDDMLDVSRLQAGVLSIRRDRCAAATIVAQVRPSLDRKAAIRKARFFVAVDDSLPEVFCDPDKVGRIIVNLTVNALKFCGDPGEVTLWAKSDTENSQVTIGVTVNGPGIDADRLAERFQRPHRIDAQSIGCDERLELGLSIAKELAEMNFGQLGVAIQPDEGRTLSFSIPLANPAAVVPRYVDWIAMRQRTGVLSVLTARIDESTHGQTADEVHALLSCGLRQVDLLFRVARCHWLLVLPLRPERTNRFIDRMAQLCRHRNRNRPQGPLPEISIRVDSSCRLDVARTEILAHLPTLATPMGQTVA